jgi:3D (Asp-Asp-Asp) domain-containing protein
LSQPKIATLTAGQVFLPLAARTVGAVAVIALVMGSAVWTKRAGSLPALVGFDRSATLAAESAPSAEIPESQPESETAPEPVEVLAVEPVTESDPEWDLSTRWFDGRPVRPSKVVLMRVTGYSPDSRSCGEFADGQTATLHSVWTNAMRLVAADPKVLPYGTMLTVPGYADGEIVPVLDCGGAIKGARLDLLFPTHEVALNWGVQDLRVVVWEYADGQPAPNPRRVR